VCGDPHRGDEALVPGSEGPVERSAGAGGPVQVLGVADRVELQEVDVVDRSRSNDRRMLS